MKLRGARRTGARIGDGIDRKCQSAGIETVERVAGEPPCEVGAEPSLDVAVGSWLCKNTLSQGPEWDEVLMRTGLSGFDYARIAAISGCMPIMFITLVRL